MSKIQTDILIVGAGIAGLWLFHFLKKKNYDVLLLTDQGIGAGQTIASQGILHSGLKYTLAGKVNALAKSISQMPERWREALDSDLKDAKISSPSQHLMIPPGIAGDLIKIATEKTFGDSVQAGQSPYPGFEGSVLDMGEMVLDIPSVIQALAEPYRGCIRVSKNIILHNAKPLDESPVVSADGIEIAARRVVYTAAAHNMVAARKNGHDDGLETQHRPLINVFVKNAPFPLYAHFVGTSDKPVATVTTHETKDGDLVWYLGGQVAERPLDDDPRNAYDFALKAFETYLPGLDASGFEWAALPIDRVEGKSGSKGFMPDTPTIHQVENHLYCWPTKLTFAPMLADMVMERIDFEPSGAQSDFSELEQADYAKAPWDEAEWTKLN